MVETSEWRNFGSENGERNPHRVEGRLNPYLSTGVNKELTRAHKVLQRGKKVIKKFAHYLNLKAPTIVKAFEFFKQIVYSGQLRRRRIVTKVAVVIFMASRLTDQPKSLKTILAFTDCSTKELSKCYKSLRRL